MQVVHGDQISRIRGLEHRGGTFHSRTLVSGEPGSPDNFKFSLSENDTDHFGPRHRHNFDQFRFMIDGEADFDRDGSLKPGMLGYFPEGLHYGPQVNKRKTLVAIVQFGSASGSGYLQPKEVRAGMEAMKALGEFKEGIFRRHADVEGKRNMDGYQAIWEHVHGRSMVYSKPRYEKPVLMDSANFDWIPVPGEQGVSEKAFGTFTERRASARLVRLEKGARYGITGRSLYLVLSGEGTVGDEPLRKDTTVFLKAAETATLVAGATTELLHYGLPDLSDLAERARVPAEAAE